jgi:hypothetical protein
MTRKEALAECRRLGDEPGEEGVSFMPRETAAGEWTVVKVRAPARPAPDDGAPSPPQHNPNP